MDTEANQAVAEIRLTLPAKLVEARMSRMDPSNPRYGSIREKRKRAVSELIESTWRRAQFAYFQPVEHVAALAQEIRADLRLSREAL